ncbi:MAG: protein-L-isoaspartate(D-aspartate) O-methyltransferase [Verrucomicrobiota bacterium]
MQYNRQELFSGKGLFVALAAISAIFAIPDTGADDYAEQRRQMVKQQLVRRNIEDEKVLEAMLAAPRHKFVAKQQQRSAYRDRPLPIGHGQTISQPYIVAYMTELLELDEDDKVLEIGTGSGYQAAVLAEIVEHVYTIEIIPELAESAAKHLQTAGYDEVASKAGNGYFGWEEHAPFDAIIVTAAASHIPPPLVEQLKPDGRMVIPVGPVTQVQKLVLVTKEDGDVIKRPKMPVRFVPLRGAKQNENKQ